MFHTFKLIKQRRLVMVYAPQHRPHERLADETAAVANTVTFAETVQHPLLTVVEQNTDSMLAWLLLHIKTTEPV